MAMAETLYRKYRPQTFADLVGQQHVRVTLEQAILSDRVAHAYLFTGPRGVGKTTTARLLARAVNCLQRGKKAEPCNECANCRAILTNRTLDIMEIDAASQTGVDNVRENIIQSARAWPSMLTKKVFIIDEVHMLSLAAFNALLKLMEEPPAHAMFILATTDVHRVPETVISRTQRFDFQRVGIEDMIQRLQTLAGREGRRLGPGVAERIARNAGGSLRDAESLLGQVFSFGDKEITVAQLDVVLPRSDHERVREFLGALVPGQTADAMKLFHQFVADGGDITTFVQDVLSLSRHLLLLTVNRNAATDIAKIEDAATVEHLNRLAASTNAQRVIDILEALSIALRQLPSTSIEELPVEVAIVRASLSVNESPPPATPSGRGPETPPVTSPPSPPPAPKKSTPTKQKNFSLEVVRQAWSRLQASPSLPPSLALSVKQAEVTRADGDTIELIVPYSLHADRLQNAKNIDLIHQQLSDWPQFRLVVRVDQQRAVAEPLVAPRPEAAVPKPTTLSPQAMPVVSGDKLWDSLVSSLGESA